MGSQVVTLPTVVGLGQRPVRVRLDFPPGLLAFLAQPVLPGLPPDLGPVFLRQPPLRLLAFFV